MGGLGGMGLDSGPTQGGSASCPSVRSATGGATAGGRDGGLIDVSPEGYRSPGPGSTGVRRLPAGHSFFRTLTISQEVPVGSIPRRIGPFRPFQPLLLLPVLLTVLSPTAAAQTPGPVSTPEADPGDVSSVDGLVAAVYDVISGPAGEARNWNRWRSLFLPEARLISVGLSREGETTYRVMTPEDYVELAGASLEENGFFEEEIGRTQEEFGPVVHLFSAYASRRRLDDPEPFARGINSFQLMYDGDRWWVVTIYWTSERPDLPIPERYIGG